MKLATGTGEIGPSANDAPKMIASIAPSDAPAETPSVNGVASGFRSSAWNTTPADASVAPTIAAAMTRGRRATKKICASTFWSNGIDRSNTRARLIVVLPTSGARTVVATARVPNPASVSSRRVRIDLADRCQGRAAWAAASAPSTEPEPGVTFTRENEPPADEDGSDRLTGVLLGRR